MTCARERERERERENGKHASNYETHFVGNSLTILYLPLGPRGPIPPVKYNLLI